MALQKLTSLTVGAPARAITNAAFDAIDANTAGLALEIQQRQDASAAEIRLRDNAISVEAGYRAANVDELRTADGIERLARIASVSAVATDLASEVRNRLAAAVASMSRPGDGPTSFTFGAVSGTSTSLPPLPDGMMAVGDQGREAMMLGAGVMASRRAVALEPGRIYRPRFAFQRRSNPADPSGHAIICGLAYLDQAANLIPGGKVPIKTFGNVHTSDGLQPAATTVGRSTGGKALKEAPAAACYVRGYVETFGDDGATAIQCIDIVDITDLALVPDIAAEAVGRIGTLESFNVGPRLNAVEQAIGNPLSQTFRTRSDAASSNIPAAITALSLLGRTAAGDGYGRLYGRVSSLASGADGFTTADGGVWQRASPIERASGGTADRLLADILGDMPSVRNAGARGDGTGLDTSAFATLAGGSPRSRMILVPDGRYPVDPTGVPTIAGQDPIWFGSPLNADGTDTLGLPGVTFSAIVGRLQIDKKFNAKPSDFASLFMFRDATNYDGSTDPGIASNLRVHTRVGAGAAQEWTLTSIIEMTKAGSNIGVAGYLQALKKADALTWSLVVDTIDYVINPTKASIGAEIGLVCNGADDNSQRVMLDLSAGKRDLSGAQGIIGYAIRVGPRFEPGRAGDDVLFRYGLALEGLMETPIDLTRQNASFNGRAIAFASNTRMQWFAGGNPVGGLGYFGGFQMTGWQTATQGFPGAAQPIPANPLTYLKLDTEFGTVLIPVYKPSA